MVQRIITVKGVDTSRTPNPIPIHAPVDKALKVTDAILVSGDNETFGLWQDVAWYFTVDPLASALFQKPGANLQGSMIMVMLS